MIDPIADVLLGALLALLVTVIGLRWSNKETP